MKKFFKNKKVRKILVYVLVALGLVALFLVLHHFATIERGYKAIGGEALIFLIPVIWKAAFKGTVKEIKEIISRSNNE